MTLRCSTLATALWLGVHLVLLVALGLGFIWPLVDAQAVERDPWHNHLVLGGTEAARSQALAAHLHAGLAFDYPAPLAPLEAVPTEAEARVIVVGSHEGAAGWSLGQLAKNLLTPMLLTLACLALMSQAVPRLTPQRRPLALRRLYPPPRLPA